MFLTTHALQSNTSCRPQRLSLQQLPQPGKSVHLFQRRPALIPRHRTCARPEQRSSVESSTPETHVPAQQQPGSETWQPASLAAGWAGSSTLLLSLGAAMFGLLGTGFDLEGPGSVLEALGVLALTVTVHELGHFVAARGQNIHVTKFAVGFGPIVWKYQGKEVEYSVRALPLGGFVAFPDDDPDCKYPPDDPNLLRNRPVRDRIIVVCAGVVMNMVFAFLTCTTQATTVGINQVDYKPGVLIGAVNEGAVAQLAGLQKGDIILQVADMKVAPTPSAVSDVVNKIGVNPKRPLTLKVDRQGEVIDVPITPAEQPDGSGRIGVALGSNSTVARVKAGNIVEGLSLGAQQVVQLTGGVAKGLSQLFTNFSQTAEQVSGPVAILAVGAEVARRDASGLYQFCALININLAIVNILPLPALDGGYLVFLVIEALRGKKVNAELEKGIMASGILLLMTVGIVLVVRDTLTLSGLIQ